MHSDDGHFVAGGAFPYATSWGSLERARCRVLKELGEIYRRRASWMLRWSERMSLVFQAAALACALTLVILSRFKGCDTSDVVFAIGLVQVLVGGLQALADKMVPLRATVEAGRQAERFIVESELGGGAAVGAAGGTIGAVGGVGGVDGASSMDTPIETPRHPNDACSIPLWRRWVQGKVGLIGESSQARESQLWRTLRAYDSQREIPMPTKPFPSI